MTLVSRYATFLYEALKLQEAKIPIDLDSQIIQATIDAYQNGWALAVYNHQKFTRGLQFANSVVLISAESFPPSTTGAANEIKQKKLIAMNYEATTLNGASATLKYRRIDGENQEVIVRDQTIASGTALIRDWLDDIMQNSQATLWIPPGWQLVLDIDATGVAEDTLIIQLLWAELPAGFNVGFA